MLLYSSSTTPPTVSAAQNQSPIKHIIVVMEENHSFDNYFGTFPGVNNTSWGIDSSICDPVNLTKLSDGCMKPFNGDNISNQIEEISLQHTGVSSRMAFNGGMDDGFVYAQAYYGKPNQKLHADWAMSYFTNATIPDYWDYASYYTLDANFFSSALSYSFPNHIFSVAGQMNCPIANAAVCGPSGGDDFNYTFPTIVNNLDAYGITWKYYAGDWKLSNDCTPVTGITEFGNHTKLDDKSQSYWNVLPDFPAVQLGPTCHRIQNVQSLFNNIAEGKLSQVSWVTPLTNESDHPSLASFPSSQMFIAKLIDSLSQNPKIWQSTVVFITWDEFGGFFDNVTPIQIDKWGLGFRVPLLIISPYAEQGAVFPSTEEDFSAFLSTIESNWNLPCLARDCSELSLLNLLNFSQTPRAPLILPDNALTIYPLSTCISLSLCETGYSSAIHLSNPPVYPGFNQTAPEDGDFS